MKSLNEIMNVKLRAGQVFYCYDLRKKALGEPYQSSIWSEEQLKRLFESGEIDDVNFVFNIRKSAEMGYSYNSDTARNSKRSITDLKKEGVI